MTLSYRTFTLPALQWLFDRYMRWRLPALLAPAYPVLLEYAIHPAPRYGEGKPPHEKLAALLALRDDEYRRTLLEIAAFSDAMARIPEAAPADPGECYWENLYFSAMDAIALYGMLGLKNPARYVEVGSGNSTKFARRAVRDLRLKTQITSIDPAPRAEVDALCDRVIRQPLEDVDTAIFDSLDEGDILFIDNSHRVFQNSDVTVFFLEILPNLKPGILLHIHDIFLPFDYPGIWAERHYSEQYLLAAYLLAAYEKLEVVLPLAYLSQHGPAQALVNSAWPQLPLQRAFARHRQYTGGYDGVSFWMRVK